MEFLGIDPNWSGVGGMLVPTQVSRCMRGVGVGRAHSGVDPGTWVWWGIRLQ